MRSYLTVCAFAIAASVQAAPIDAGVLEDLTAGLQGVMPGQGNKQPVDNNALTTGQNSGTNGEGIINDVLKSTSFRVPVLSPDYKLASLDPPDPPADAPAELGEA
ncbi:hypothetical protein A1F97_03372 [Pyrenophora tritici-repentis]|nr:hypothetical protein A1F97_03372 [Pyrenophora tritici-repentis]